MVAVNLKQYECTITPDEIKSARKLLKEYQPANEAINAVELNCNSSRSIDRYYYCSLYPENWLECLL